MLNLICGFALGCFFGYFLKCLLIVCHKNKMISSESKKDGSTKSDEENIEDEKNSESVKSEPEKSEETTRL